MSERARLGFERAEGPRSVFMTHVWVAGSGRLVIDGR